MAINIYIQGFYMAIAGSTNTDNYSGDGSSSTNGTTPIAAYAAPANPSAARLAVSGLVAGAGNALADIAGRVFNFNFKEANGNTVDPTVDWRVRISLQPGTAALFYSDPTNPIMYPLSQTSGVVFPYTPSITVRHAARYGATALTHANYSSYFYEGSEVSTININAEFTVQNIEEGQYLAATIQFFRTMTKMFYGGSRLAGTPPPMVFLNGYGESYMPNVPCVVTEFSHTMPNDVDYIEVPVGVNLNNVAGQQINATNFASRTRLPTASSISLSLQPVYSRNNVSDNFTLEKYAAGGLIQGSNSPRGGFL